MRIRGESRTLSEKQRLAFLRALREMQRVGQDVGERIYGAKFRSMDYILFKHAIAAFHPCADQGRLAVNQMTSHRALLLEWEASVLAILETNRKKERKFWKECRTGISQLILIRGNMDRMQFVQIFRKCIWGS